MKVVIYTWAFYPVPGGTQSFVRELASGLMQHHSSQPDQIEVTVVTSTPGPPTDDAAFPFRVVRRPSLARFASLLRGADILHVAGPALLPAMLALLLRTNLVMEHHGFQAACPNGQMFFEPEQIPCSGHYLARNYFTCIACNRASVGAVRSIQMLSMTPLRRWLANGARFNIMPTAWLNRVLRLRRAETIHHGVSSASDFVFAASLATGTEFAFQGRLVSTKGVDVLLRAAAILRAEGAAFRLRILGDGPEMASLRAQASTLGNVVEFVGHVPEDRLETELARAATVVVPSLGGEVFGLVAAENMLRGKLLIVSDIGSLMEVVGDSGMVFATGNPRALAACMRSVIERPSLAAELGARARGRAMQLFARDSMIERHVALYRKTLLPSTTRDSNR